MRSCAATRSAVAGGVERFEGYVAKLMGDGVLAYFGWPRAHEDDAERAVRAGLAVTVAVARLRTPAGRPLAARVGIATGLVVVGELIGEGAAKEQTVVGETPNLSARLQALAVPGRVVISEATRRLVGGLFELVDLGPQRLKGFAAPLAAWQVDGEGRAEGRFEALHGERLTPLVGREHELGILLERWAWAKDGDGQGVLLSGEPGIGKSRLIRTLRERLGDEPYTPLCHYCSPYTTNSALHPVIGLLDGRRASTAMSRGRRSWPSSRRCSPVRATGWTTSCPCSQPCSGCRPVCAIRHWRSRQRCKSGGRCRHWLTSSWPSQHGSRSSLCTRTCTGSTRRPLSSWAS